MNSRPAVRVLGWLYGTRRALATAAVLVLAAVFAFHAIFGQNGLLAYSHKRDEDHALKARIEAVSVENARLHDQVEHLQTDPDAVEMEARQRLHYTRPGEIIYTLDRPVDGSATTASGPGR